MQTWRTLASKHLKLQMCVCHRRSDYKRHSHRKKENSWKNNGEKIEKDGKPRPTLSRHIGLINPITCWQCVRHWRSTYNINSRCKYKSIKKLEFEFEFAFEFEFGGWLILPFCQATVYTCRGLKRTWTTTGDDARSRLLSRQNCRRLPTTVGDWSINQALVQERRNSSALAMELRVSCTKPSIVFVGDNTAWSSIEAQPKHIITCPYTMVWMLLFSGA